MIISMKVNASKNDVDYVIRRAHSLGLETHVSRDGEHTLIGLLGDLRALNPTALAGLHGVERVIPMEKPFRLASRDFRPEPTVIPLDGYRIGGEQIIVMAGPCAVENRKQLMETAWKVKEAGARMLRGGAFKPRTSPYSFQGLGKRG